MREIRRPAPTVELTFNTHELQLMIGALDLAEQRLSDAGEYNTSDTVHTLAVYLDFHRERIQAGVA